MNQTEQDETDRALEKLLSTAASTDTSTDPEMRAFLETEAAGRRDARISEERRRAWHAYHQGQAVRLRRNLEALAAKHEAAAARLAETG